MEVSTKYIRKYSTKYSSKFISKYSTEYRTKYSTVQSKVSNIKVELLVKSKFYPNTFDKYKRIPSFIDFFQSKRVKKKEMNIVKLVF